jgi:hypothetical protein
MIDFTVAGSPHGFESHAPSGLKLDDLSDGDVQCPAMAITASPTHSS